MENTLLRIKDRSAQIGVVGLGYVGLPLAVEIANAGFKTLGIDISSERVACINAGDNYIADVNDAKFFELTANESLSASSDFARLVECDVILVCVPTPLGKGKDPDLSYVISSVTELRKYLRDGHVIILESTTYPGTTEDIVLPILEESGLQVGNDFSLAFSPERIDPGNNQYGLKNTPKVIGGVTSRCTEVAQSFYASFVDGIHTVSSTRSAEMVKLLENTFRAINIGLANEIAIMCHRLGINTWEVIDAAASKPFGFMPFYPGPGLGGHCIPIDPHYLVWRLKRLNYNPRFIQLADEVNSSMPQYVVSLISDALNNHGKPLKNAEILILGVAYKKDIDDYRESPALDIIETLQEAGAHVAFHDPHVSHIKVKDIEMTSIAKLENLSQYDSVVIVTDHSIFDYDHIVNSAPLVIDTRNATRNIHKSDNVVRL